MKSIHNTWSLGKAIETGFTLVELMVVVTIFAMITMVTISNHSNYDNSLLLTNLTYDVAITIREAQVYGLSVKGFGVDDDAFTSGYGVHFDIANTNSFAFFADRGGTSRNYKYDFLGGELINETTLLSGFTIKRFCVGPSASERCSDGFIDPIDSLNIVFVRPDPDATITNDAGTTFSRARITIASPRGTSERDIIIEATGQIAVP